ncbi:hypothetical protein Bsp3421_000490 (plasmid) [Burkholderia sp. FERM BP-3421]|jgi:hypothetical protein|uniref:hypothetical protein n=1 Tax=Burkholderia sp. FERM BP-3421 TaxID=1494466 RepID=UPI0023607C81|nr:hypothetical protein [Burkholderia sp. FERM BP-3421]WDD90626.1 hypothetical protein Bsp3421_000490 [Burkholderia sp. FERM BP-3421]
MAVVALERDARPLRAASLHAGRRMRRPRHDRRGIRRIDERRACRFEAASALRLSTVPGDAAASRVRRALIRSHSAREAGMPTEPCPRESIPHIFNRLYAHDRIERIRIENTRFIRKQQILT